MSYREGNLPRATEPIHSSAGGPQGQPMVWGSQEGVSWVLSLLSSQGIRLWPLKAVIQTFWPPPSFLMINTRPMNVER